MFKKKSTRERYEIHEVLSDASFQTDKYAADYTPNQYESRLNLWLGHLPLLLFLALGSVFIGKIFQLQHDTERNLSQQAENNAYQTIELVADRGNIYDRNNVPLVWNVKSEGEEFSRRTYYAEPGFTHILGFISPPLKDNNDNLSRSTYVARSGVEKVFDNILQGENGVIRTESSVTLDPLSGTQIDQAETGSDLILSIDAGLQGAFYNSIKSLAEQVEFARGSGAIMDIHSGEILALTNYPEYNRNFNQAESDQSFLNLFTHGLFTPGSIIKPFVALAALNEGVISPEKHILSTKTIVIPNPYNPSNPTYFSDWKAHGYVDVRDAIAVSSNAYFYAAGGGLHDQKGVGITKINQYASAFGLDQGAGIKGFEPVTGVMPSVAWKEQVYPDDPTWRLGDTFLTSIGQYGWQTTPLQMLRAVAGIANRGTLVTPKITVNEPVESQPVSIIIDDKWYQIVHEGMRQAVEDGTARGLNVPYVQVAAKTGTAELGVSKENVNSWVMGFWPYHNPKYAFVVMMNEGSRYNLTGATFAMRSLFDWLNENNSPYLNPENDNQ